MQTKKKVLIGGLSSLAVAAGVALTGGTSAYYYDLESSDGNKLGACSLDLVAGQPSIVQTADGSPGGSDETISISTDPDDPGYTDGPGTSWDGPMAGGLYVVGIEGMEPGDKFEVTIPVDNAGECIGELWGDLRGPFKDLEGVQYEPETNWQNAGNDPDKPSGTDDESTALIALDPSLTTSVIDTYDGGAGDLDNRVLVDYGPDDAGNVVADETFSVFAWRKPTKMDPQFEPTESTNIVVKLELPDNGPGDGNEVMGDSFEFLIDLALAQPGKLNSSNTTNGLQAVATPQP